MHVRSVEHKVIFLKSVMLTVPSMIDGKGGGGGRCWFGGGVEVRERYCPYIRVLPCLSACLLISLLENNYCKTENPEYC